MGFLREPEYNFVDIQNILDAARHLQEAGKLEKCRELIRDLANELLEKPVNKTPKS